MELAMFSFSLVVGSLVPVATGVWHYRRRGDAFAAAGVGVFLGLFLLGIFQLLFWGFACTIYDAMNIKTSRISDSLAVSSRESVILRESLFLAMCCAIVCLFSQMIVLPAFLTWHRLHPASFRCVVRHVPRRNNSNAGECY